LLRVGHDRDRRLLTRLDAPRRAGSSGVCAAGLHRRAGLAVHSPMTLRLAGLAALALLSSACTYRLQSPAPQAAVLDYSDHEHYDRPFAADPARPAAATPDAVAAFEGETPSSARDAGAAIGFVAGAARPRPTAIEASSTDYEEVEATPGTACYQAALEAGITRGTCTLVVERKFLLVGEQADGAQAD
jgi:hypothetical protein